ncbi:CyP450 monooxygenase [Lentinus tigrinus ALCF2SS1-7]|uniref:CyP450 monooxygenase n=1 Tax=Lentinus tigrinus ALCF2SS1-7 TaxID=1328758 RepID=UPI001165DEE9|nr:CyP450 monooxygenase [Lentinus tigrinus ALCF2SS1-7]
MADSLPSPTVATLLCGVCLLLVHLYYRCRSFYTRSRGRPLPPGPRPLPIVGNLFDIPKRHPWRIYKELSKQYGKITSFQAMGQTLVVIDDPAIAVELLEKRSTVYSSRPDSIVVEMLGFRWNVGLMPYGQGWRSRRRVVWQHFHPGILHRYNLLLETNAQRILRRLLAGSADELEDNIRYSLGTALIQVSYGLEAAEVDDKHIATFEDAIESLELLLSGANILEFLPFLARLPTWFPGMGILRRIAHYRQAIVAMKDDTWNDAKTAKRSGNAPASVAGALLEKLSHLDENVSTQEDLYKEAVVVAYAAGIDTTYVSLCSFFLAMSLFPNVQKKAREELDVVVGSTRLPTLADRPNLPYIGAIVKEVLRWHIATPLGLAHLSTADDEYDGFFIPEGSLVMANVWSILHNPEKYPQPDAFVPERFIKDGSLSMDAGDPANFLFGFGRRICPGRYFAEAALFIYIASVLHTLEISPPLDEGGRPIHIEPRPTSGLVSQLEDCRCNVKPRADWADALIRGSG